MSQEDQVTRKEVLDTAKRFIPASIGYSAALGGTILLEKQVVELGLMSSAYITPALDFLTFCLVFVGAILVFSWGFVLYLFLEYLQDSEVIQQ